MTVLDWDAWGQLYCSAFCVSLLARRALDEIMRDIFFEDICIDYVLLMPWRPLRRRRGVREYFRGSVGFDIAFVH